MTTDKAIEVLRNETKVCERAKKNLEEWKNIYGVKKFDRDISRFENKIEAMETLINKVEKVRDSIELLKNDYNNITNVEMQGYKDGLGYALSKLKEDIQ